MSIARPAQAPRLRGRALGCAGRGEPRRRPPARPLRRRPDPLRHDAAADDARRAPAADGAAGDPLRSRPDQGGQGRRLGRGHARSADREPDLGRLRRPDRGDEAALRGDPARRRARPARRRGARLLRRLRRAPGQAALGRQDARLHALDHPDRPRPARDPLHPPDPRRPRRRPEPDGAGDQRAAAARRAGGEVGQADRQVARAGGEARRRPLHRGPLRGPRARSRARAAPDLRAHRDRLRPGDADLLRGRRRAPAGDVRGAARGRHPRRAGRGLPDRQPQADHRAPRPDQARQVAPRDEPRGPEGLRRRRRPDCSKSSATR